MLLTERIRLLYEKSREIYGRPCVRAELVAQACASEEGGSLAHAPGRHAEVCKRRATAQFVLAVLNTALTQRKPQGVVHQSG